jgi:hypothetical protein
LGVTGPVPVTAQSHPLLASGDSLAQAGYVEEEFLISGRAHVYDWASDGKTVRAITAPSPYTTRILVRRPSDPKRFSGNVVVEVLNATQGADLAGTWSAAGRSIQRRGDVWIGITSKGLTAKALQRFDPQRYAAINWRNPVPADQACEYPSSFPYYTMGGLEAAKKRPPSNFADTEDGLFWDMFAQLGQGLKGAERQKVLPGFRQPRLFATGVSQSGSMLRTWVNGFHPKLQMADGRPIYDGYLIEVGQFGYLINQCADHETPLSDPRHNISVVDAPVINLISEGDMWLAAHTRPANVVKARWGVVNYEVAGSSHGGGGSSNALPPLADLQRAGVSLASRGSLPAGVMPNDLPRHYLSAAALRNLEDWSNRGIAPPPSAELSIDANGEIRRDKWGNALGGLRMPQVEVPAATYHGSIGSSLAGGALMGSKTPFTLDQLKQLYPSKADYVARFSAEVDRLARDRWVLAEDAPALKAEAASVPDW